MPARSSMPGAKLAASGLRMPAEWERHDATWLAWPHYRDAWPGKFEPIPWVYAEIIRHLARHERVELIVNDAAGGKKGGHKKFFSPPTHPQQPLSSSCT